MKKINRLLVGFITITVSIFILLDCSRNKNPISSQSTSNFQIYFLANSDLQFIDVADKPINSIKISNTPVATDKDINYYKIFTHSERPPLSHAINFKYEMKDKFGYKNCPFLLTVNGEHIYLGEYWANFMSTIPPNIFVYPYSNTEFHILAIDEGIDKINDDRIINALKKAGVAIVYDDIGNN